MDTYVHAYEWTGLKPLQNYIKINHVFEFLADDDDDDDDDEEEEEVTRGENYE